MYGFHGFPLACNTRGDLAEEVAGSPQRPYGFRLARLWEGESEAVYCQGRGADRRNLALYLGVGQNLYMYPLVI